MRIDSSKWSQYREEEENTAKKYVFHDDGRQVLVIKSQSTTSEFVRSELLDVLTRVREFISNTNENPVRNRYCSHGCETEHYWYTLMDLEIRTDFQDLQNNIDLLDRAIQQNQE